MPDPWLFASFAVKSGLLISLLHFAGGAFIAATMPLVATYPWRWWAASVLFVALVLPVTSAALMGSAAGLWDAGLLRALWATPVGTAAIVSLAGLSIAAFGQVFSPVLAGLGAILALAGLVFSGHVAAQAGPILQALLLLHVCIAAWWVGVLAPLRRLAGAAPDRAADVGERFGRIAALLVPIMLAAGVIIGAYLTGGPAKLITTDYGRLLLFKVLSVAFLLAFAAANKLRHVPDLKAGKPAAAARLASSIRAEQAVVWAILIQTAALTTFVGPQ